MQDRKKEIKTEENVSNEAEETDSTRRCVELCGSDNKPFEGGAIAYGC